jgi:hypothetical protein
MSGLSCIQMADLLDELALEVLPGDLRASALDHLEVCPACRGRLEELSESADHLLFAYRPVDPPPGFEDRVLARLGTERARPRHRFRLLAPVAAAVAVVALAAGGGVGLSRAGQHHASVEARSHELRTVSLISSRGQRIGDVSAYAGTPAWFFMRVDHGAGSATYRCVLDVDGGSTVAIGTMVVSDGHGGWGQRVGIDARRVRSARLVSSAGDTIATATFQLPPRLQR